jgi:hypothetical protein
VELAEKGAVRLTPRLEQTLAPRGLTAVLVLEFDEFSSVVSLAARLQPAEDDARDANERAENRCC